MCSLQNSDLHLAPDGAVGYVRAPRNKRRLLMDALQSSGPVVWYAAGAGEPLASTFVARETGPGGPPKPRLLDRVREAIRLATTASAPRRPTSPGFAATSCSTASATLPRWARPRSRSS